jgi:hypothetical protein
VNPVQLGTAYATALARKDSTALGQLLADDVDFRALTPRKHWQMSTAQEVIADAIGVWFGEGDHIEALSSVSVQPVAGERWHLSYRLHVRNADGPHTVEQQAYFDCANGRITWLRVLCAGYIPA